MRLRKRIWVIALACLFIGMLAVAAFSQLLLGPSVNQLEKPEERDIVIRVRNAIYNPERWDVKKWAEDGNFWIMRIPFNVVWFHATHPRVKVVGIDWDMWGAEAGQRLMAGLASGNAPSMYYYGGMGNIPTCVEKGVLADITDVVLTRQSQWWESIPEYIRENCMYKGRIWALPKSQSSSYPGDAMRYRKDYFEEAGIFNEKGEPAPSYEWTWDDFREIAKKLTDPKQKRWGTVLEARCGDRSTFERICQTFGVPILRPDPSGEYTWRAAFDTKETLDTAFKLYHDLVFEDKSALVSVEYDWTGTRNEYLSGRVGMFYFPYSHTVQRALEEPHRFDPVKFSIDIDGVVPWPKGPSGTRKFNESAEVGAEIGFDPTLNKEQLEAVVDWYLFWEFGGGKFLSTLSRYVVYGLPEYGVADVIGSKDMVQLPGVPSMDETMPKDYLECKQFLHGQPVPPIRGNYNLELLDLTGFRGGIDSSVQAAITNPDWNGVVKSIQSAAKQVNVSALNNKTGTMEDVKAYFTALDKYYQDNYPEYYEKMFKSLWEKYYKVW